jgi:hypothetical protein
MGISIAEHFMAEQTEKGTFFSRAVIVMYAMALIFIGWQPLREKYGRDLRRLRNSVVDYFQSSGPAVRTGSAERSSSEASLARRPIEEKNLLEPRPRARTERKLDSLSGDDKKELQHVLDNL